MTGLIQGRWRYLSSKDGEVDLTFVLFFLGTAGISWLTYFALPRSWSSGKRQIIAYALFMFLFILLFILY